MVQRRVRRLDLDKIVEVALELLAEDGRFTMLGLASRLGVTVSSIYHHVAGRAALVECIRVRVTAPMHSVQIDERDWEQAVTGWLTNCREAFARHPEAITLLTSAETNTPSVISDHDQLAVALGNAGFPATEVKSWISVLNYYGIGAAVELAAELVGPQHSGRAQADLAFQLGVRAMIDGMRVALADRN